MQSRLSVFVSNKTGMDSGREVIHYFSETGHNEKENEKLEKMHDNADGSLAS